MNSSSENNRAGHPDIRTLEGKVAFLRGLPFFTDTPLATIHLYAYLCKKEEYPAGETVVLQGEPADRMFLITTGMITICELHRNREFQLQTLSADGLNYFGELALLTDFEWFFSARALTDVTLLSITREAFHKVMEKFPERFSETVSKIIRLRIRRFIDQTDYLLDNLKEEAWRECPASPPNT
jgi:CRP-like cAMP-binding protein